MRIFSSNWTRWEDILVFTFGYKNYLLQGKKNLKTNRKKFKVTSCSGLSTAYASNVTEEKLVEKGLFDNHTMRPPIGIKPKWLADEQRFKELGECIERYKNAGVEPMKEWLEEFENLKNNLKIINNED
jgi:hypothetical protein